MFQVLSAVITSINSPTVAVRAFCDLQIEVVVVGDMKTPTDWGCPPALFLPVSGQASPLAHSLPFNHYARKMLGYVHAKNMGCTVIYDTDDDNIPKANWHVPSFEGEFETTAQDVGFVNVYQRFTDAMIWPRGLPLECIRKNYADVFSSAKLSHCKVGVWQGLADVDPDVDAIYRLVVGQECTFDEASPVVLGKGTVCPFNTQNTFIRRELFPLLYIPSTVTFRFCDILRGLIAQPLLWNAGFCLGFMNATVWQDRNAHNLQKDFMDEVPMYQHVNAIVPLVQDALSTHTSVSDDLFRAYARLHKEGIVQQEELGRLELWLREIDIS